MINKEDIRIRIRIYHEESQNYLYGYINSKGEEIIAPQFELAGDFTEGFAAVGDEDKMGYIDINGNWVIEKIYDDAGEFSEGLAPVLKEGKWGYIDINGNTVIAHQYDTAFMFSDGVAEVSVDDKYGFIDKTGKAVVPLQYDYADSQFSYNGYISMGADGETICYDISGNKIWPKENCL